MNKLKPSLFLKYVFNALGTSLIGANYIAVTYFASEFVVNAIGGSGYAEIYSDVWLFAIEASLFAFLQVLLYREDIKVSFYLMLGSLFAISSVLLTSFETNVSIVVTLIRVTFLLNLRVGITELRN